MKRCNTCFAPTLMNGHCVECHGEPPTPWFIVVLSFVIGTLVVLSGVAVFVRAL